MALPPCSICEANEPSVLHTNIKTGDTINICGDDLVVFHAQMLAMLTGSDPESLMALVLNEDGDGPTNAAADEADDENDEAPPSGKRGRSRTQPRPTSSTEVEPPASAESGSAAADDAPGDQ